VKFLFCSRNPFDRRLGAPKVLLELGTELEGEGSACKFLNASDLGVADLSGWTGRAEFSRRLAEYLDAHADSFDVIEVDHEDLPFPRSRFSRRPLIVARSVLLVHHLESIRIPTPGTLRSLVGAVLKGRSRRKMQDLRIESAIRTIREADLVNVCNFHDRDELVRRGIPASKILVLPFGLNSQRRAQFESLPVAVPTGEPVVGFVGTFDFRKGAREFPHIVRQVAAAVPNVRFRLFGTAGLFPTEHAVLSYFPRSVRDRVEVHARFDPDRLPSMLGGISVGLFPSYIEGFGFGVLEMLAAAIPVAAYDAPGAPMMLPPDWLVKRGDAGGIADRLVGWLSQGPGLESTRRQARACSEAFAWDRIARQTLEAYQAALSRNSRELTR